MCTPIICIEVVNVAAGLGESLLGLQHLSRHHVSLSHSLQLYCHYCVSCLLLTCYSIPLFVCTGANGTTLQKFIP